MIFKKHEEVKTTHHIVVVNGYTIHRREKLEYDFNLLKTYNVPLVKR